MDGKLPILGANGLQTLPIADVMAGVLAVPCAQIAALQAALTALAARVVALEARPEEVAHFAASAKFPTIAALAKVSLTLTGLAPARADDVLRAGERISVVPVLPLPDGLTLLSWSVAADNTVVLRLSASVALAASSAPFLWGIVALR